MILIGLTGPMASGKDTVIQTLKKKGFKNVTMSAIIKLEADKAGIPHERARIQDFANSVRAKEGAGCWAKRCMDKIESDGGDHWVVDGIRNPSEVDEFKKVPSFVLIAVMLSEDEIVKRIVTRKRDIDPTDPKEIKGKLLRDWGVNEPPEGQQVGLCVRRADYYFDNSIPLEKVENNFLGLYDRINLEKGWGNLPRTEKTEQ